MKRFNNITILGIALISIAMLFGCAIDPNPPQHSVGQSISIEPAAVDNAELKLTPAENANVLIRALKNGKPFSVNDDDVIFNFYGVPNKLVHSYSWSALRQMYKTSNCTANDVQLLSNPSEEALLCNHYMDVSKISSIEIVAADGSKKILTTWGYDFSNENYAMIQLMF